MMTMAAQLWGYPGVENEAAFDPMVGMLINACAAEIEKIAREKNVTQLSLMEELARLLTPAADTGPLPAHAIATTMPEQAVSFIDEQQEWAYIRKTGDNTPAEELCFSPAARFLLSRCTVKYMAVQQTLFSMIDHRYKQATAQTLPGRALPPATLYIGLEADTALQQLPELCLFFDCLPERPLWEHLRNAQWKLGGTPLKSRPGFAARLHDPAKALLNDIRKKYTVNDRYCQYVLHFYKQRFVTLYDLPLQHQQAPTALQQSFSQDVLRSFPAGIVWLEAIFPGHVPYELMRNAIVLNNCFPVLNRRSHHFMYRLQPHLNILPLKCGDLFFDIKRIYDSAGRHYDLHDKAGENTVTLRTKGVNRFDTRDARELMLNLTETLKDEVAAYAALGVDTAAGALHELNTLIDNLQEKTGHVKPQEPFSYLLMQGREDGSNLFVECWSTTGVTANDLKPGHQLETLKGIDTQERRATLVTPATGGRDRLGEEEKLLAYKKALLSADRLVTAEDIRSFCLAELGNAITAVEIAHGVQTGRSAREGIMRTIDIVLTPAQGRQPDWDTLLPALHKQISFRAAGQHPYRIRLKEQQKIFS
jgi:hypothetical protein